MPDGGFPIVTKQDLKNAIKAYGRGNEPQKEKAHIIKRAKALKATDLLPEKWGSVNEGFGDLFSGSPIQLRGKFQTPEALATSKFVLDLLNTADLKAIITKDGVVKTTDKKYTLGNITPAGDLYVPGMGNYSPDDLMEKERDILIGMVTCSDIDC